MIWIWLPPSFIRRSSDQARCVPSGDHAKSTIAHCSASVHATTSRMPLPSAFIT